MKVVVFAGGIGTRISEESHLRPKPLIEVGSKPILWHIMKIYQKYGYDEFIICLGYKGYMIKEYFLNYFLHNSNVTINTGSGEITVHDDKGVDEFKVTLVDTGIHTMTAGRLKRVKEYIGDEDFMLTYGDGVADIDIKSLVDFHNSHDKVATVTSYQITAQFGVMDIADNGMIKGFKEKPKHSDTWINAGFFVLRPEIFDYLEGDMDPIMWEQDPLINLSEKEELMTYKHNGFWKAMDAMRDKKQLEEMWASGTAKWKIW
jgi:glucose-1-phosphate cytidylyltransferase